MDTGSVRALKGVATQAAPAVQQFVTSCRVSVSNDASSWTSVDGGFVFTGNVAGGRNAVVRNDFAAVVNARYVRIEPVTWVGHICLRVGVYIQDVACITTP